MDNIKSIHYRVVINELSARFLMKPHLRKTSKQENNKINALTLYNDKVMKYTVFIETENRYV